MAEIEKPKGEIVTLKNENGTQVYPVTTGEAIKVSGGKTLDEKILDDTRHLEEYVEAKLKEAFPVGIVVTTFSNNDYSSPGSFIPGTRWEKVPSGHYLMASSTASTIEQPAGLPDIEGNLWAYTYHASGDSRNGGQGAFYQCIAENSTGESYKSSTGRPRWYFKASKGEIHNGSYRNDVYGKSDTVHTIHYNVIMWKRVS